MKKKVIAFVFLIGAIFLSLPTVNAAEKVTNFKETVDEEINTFKDQSDAEEYVNKLKEADFSNYKESDDKINIYMFRGSTCGYCLQEITYLTTILKDYGKYFNLKTYEVWGNSDNSALMRKIANYLGDWSDNFGVPYLVIGKKGYSGYASSMDDTIEKAIKDEYDSKDRYDVMDHLDEMKDVSDTTSNDTSSNDTKTATSKKSSSKLSVSAFCVITIIIIILDIIYTELRINSVKKKYDSEIKNLEKKLNNKDTSKPKKNNKK